jgi:hypothetical protein
VIHLEHVSLPDGLRALAYRDARGNLVVYVSQTLDAAGQRAAVVAAIRASRRGRWRAGLPSAGIALLLGIRTTLGHAAGALRARPLAWGTAAATTMLVLGVSAAAVFITAVPQRGAPPEAAPRPSPHSMLSPRPQPGRPPARASHLAEARRAPGGTASVAPGGRTGSGRPSPGPAPTGGSSPAPATPSPTPTEPSPSPSPSRSKSPSGICVTLLGIRVCL